MGRLRSRRRWLWLCIAALPVIGGVAWVGREAGDAGRPIAGPPTAPASESMLAASVPRPVEQPAARVASASEATGSARTIRQAADSTEDGVEICGFGRIPKAELERPEKQLVPPAWAVAAEAAQAQRTNTAKSQLAARLAAGSDVQRVASRLVMGDNEGAAAIASRSQDAEAYRLGLQGCRYGESSDPPPSCRGLDVQGWIQRDAGDARPWLLLASQALQRRDVAAGKQALEEAMRRPKLSAGEPLIVAAMKDAPSAVADRVSLGSVALDVMSRQAAMGDWYVMTALGRYCSAEGIKDGQRLPLCQQLSRKLMDAADTLGEATVAQKIADRVGVPADQQKYTAASLKTAQGFFLDEWGVGFGFDCASIGRMGDHFVDRAQRGELKIALAWANRRNPAAAPATGASAALR